MVHGQVYSIAPGYDNDCSLMLMSSAMTNPRSTLYCLIVAASEQLPGLSPEHEAQWRVLRLFHMSICTSQLVPSIAAAFVDPTAAHAAPSDALTTLKQHRMCTVAVADAHVS